MTNQKPDPEILQHNLKNAMRAVEGLRARVKDLEEKLASSFTEHPVSFPEGTTARAEFLKALQEQPNTILRIDTQETLRIRALEEKLAKMQEVVDAAVAWRRAGWSGSWASQERTEGALCGIVNSYMVDNGLMPESPEGARSGGEQHEEGKP